MNSGKRGIQKSRLAQVWVETVIYTLIGLTIIGILVAVITPKINNLKDKAIITQTINSLNDLNQQVQNTLIAPGNKRQISIMIKKGEYNIDAVNESIYYVMRATNLLYSQINQSQKQGDIIILTKQKGKNYDIYLSLNYSAFNLTYQNKEAGRTLTAAPTAYNLLIEYRGGVDKQINIEPI